MTLSFLLSSPNSLLAPAFNSADAIRIETTTLLPGGGVATLTVRAAGANFDVSDEAAGRMTLLSLGIPDLTSGDTRRGDEIAQAHGLMFDGESFRAEEVSVDQLSAAIVYVAEACRAWAAGTAEARSKRKERDLAERAFGRLRAALPFPIETERELIGASTKKHRFDIVVTLPRDRFAVFEMLTASPTSMASVHTKFYDLLQAHHDWPRDAVVEDLASWAADDLAMMQQVASHVRGVGVAWDDLGRLAA